MGIFDTFKEEDKVTVTVSQLYKTLREAAKTELSNKMNAALKKVLQGMMEDL